MQHHVVIRDTGEDFWEIPCSPNSRILSALFVRYQCSTTRVDMINVVIQVWFCQSFVSYPWCSVHFFEKQCRTMAVRQINRNIALEMVVRFHPLRLLCHVLPVPATCSLERRVKMSWLLLGLQLILWPSMIRQLFGVLAVRELRIRIQFSKFWQIFGLADCEIRWW